MDKKKILVVDDEKDVLLMLEKRLVAEGYSVITATNGHNAVTLARTQSPDLHITSPKDYFVR
jgi:CheY-like chemotaxis protein